MTLEQLLTIEAIVQQGSFKAAADFLHKSQPSISMAVKKLEEEYQLTLFSRDEYRPTLTRDGKIFLEKSREVLKAYKELDGMARQMGRGEEIELKISIDAVSPVSLILKFLKRFFTSHPNTKLLLSFEVLNGTIERLLDNEVDLAITPMINRNEDHLETLSLTKTRMIPVIRKDLAGKKKLTDEFLRSQTQIILADSSRHLNKYSTGILDGGKSFTVTQISFKKEMILQGLGWGGLPLEMVKSELTKKILIPIKTPLIKESEFDIFLVRNQKKTIGPVAEELWEKFQAEFL